MILSGGGTAGHIYPALALADELRSREIDLVYVGTSTGPEARLADEAGLSFAAISTAGFNRAKPLSLLSSGAKALRGVSQAMGLLRREKPSAVVCFGGYVSVPVGIAASLRKIPLIVHEQNSHMGMTNRFLARRAQFVALTYPQTAGLPPKLTAETVFLGNPVRESVQHSDSSKARAQLGISDSEKLLLIFGGSRGARKINQATVAALATFLSERPDWHIVHGTGQLEYDSVMQGVQELGERHPELRTRYHALPYIENMGDVLAASDLVVSRAGATSIAELTVLGKPSMLVPYPYATDDHQRSNAAALVALGGARLIADDELLKAGVGYTLGTDCSDSFLYLDTLLELTGDEELLKTMAVQSAALGKSDAAVDLAEAVVKLTEN